MTPEHAAAASKQAIERLGGAYLQCPITTRRAQQWGLSGWSYHVASRGGVLGDVPADTIAAALGFFAPEIVRDAWEAARRVRAPQEIASQAIAECCRWGSDNLDNYPGIRRLSQLVAPVVRAIDSSGLPLFAAWRALPTPDVTPGARAAVLLHLLREYRLGAYLMAVRVGGLTPLEAIVAGPDGVEGASALGWTAPFPAPEPLARRWVWVEAVADTLAGRPWQTLDPDERTELAELLNDLARRCSQI